MRIKIYQVGMRKCLEVEGVRIPIKNYRVVDTLVKGKRLEIEIGLSGHTLTFEGEPDSTIQEESEK